MRAAKRHMAHPEPPGPRALALAADYAAASIECPQCHGTGMATDGLVNWQCDACDSNGRLDLRIVAARPEWLALYDDWQEVGGFFCLVEGAERMLAYCRTMEDVRAGAWFYDQLPEHAAILRALGVTGGVR